MRRPADIDDWKGWLPDQYHMIMEVSSSNLIGDVEYFVKSALYKDGRFGANAEQLKVAEAMEALAKDIREGKIKP